jgi:hypothetical protein
VINPLATAPAPLATLVAGAMKGSFMTLSVTKDPFIT